MQEKSFPNIFWVVVDCVRSYKSGKDDRDKLDIMYEMSKECADFENMIVSAPSSVMSISSCLSGVPSYYIARNYSEFKFDTDSFWTLRDILKHKGYTDCAILNARASREKLRDILSLVDKKFWPSHIKHSQIAWPNIDVSRIFFNLVDQSPLNPGFYLLWYNARRDPQISNIVSDLIVGLKQRELFDNSIFILTSDHGYPDLSRGLVSDGWDLKKVGLGHDLILTDDNIKVPFLMHMPGISPVKINAMVSSEDILPTLLDYLAISPPFAKMNFTGSSMMPLIRGENVEFFNERMVRSDARFAMQSERVTSIRSNEFKYIIRHDDSNEDLYDLREDPGEIDNRARSSKYAEVIPRFRDAFNRSENEVLRFQFQKSKSMFENFLEGKDYFDDIQTILIIVFGKSQFYRSIIAVISEKYPELKVLLAIPEELSDKISESEKYIWNGSKFVLKD